MAGRVRRRCPREPTVRPRAASRWATGGQGVIKRSAAGVGRFEATTGMAVRDAGYAAAHYQAAQVPPRPSLRRL